mgnify:CR=1 FL=1
MTVTELARQDVAPALDFALIGTGYGGVAARAVDGGLYAGEVGRPAGGAALADALRDFDEDWLHGVTGAVTRASIIR